MKLTPIFSIGILLFLSFSYSDLSQVAPIKLPYSFTFDNVNYTFYNNGMLHVVTPAWGKKDTDYGIAITGTNIILSSESFLWNASIIKYSNMIFYENEDNSTGNITINTTTILLENNNKLLTWKRNFTFKDGQSTKITDTIINKRGAVISNLTIWYYQTIEQNTPIEFNGIDLKKNDTRIRTDLRNLLPYINVNNFEFRYKDILDEGNNITEVYVGNGSIINRGDILISAIGFSTVNAGLTNNQVLVFDPIVSDWKSPTRTGQFYDQWTNGANAKTSDNAYATTDAVSKIEGTDLYGIVLPSDATVKGIEVRVEASVPS